MPQVSLPERTAEKLRQAAAIKGTDISELLGWVVERYLIEEPVMGDKTGVTEQDEQIAIIEREQRAYETQHARLLGQYAGEYIAM